MKTVITKRIPGDKKIKTLKVLNDVSEIERLANRMIIDAMNISMLGQDNKSLDVQVVRVIECIKTIKELAKDD